MCAKLLLFIIILLGSVDLYVLLCVQGAPGQAKAVVRPILTPASTKNRQQMTKAAAKQMLLWVCMCVCVAWCHAVKQSA